MPCGGLRCRHRLARAGGALAAARGGRNASLGADLAAVLSLFGTMVYTGALGALLAFARTPWYAGFALDDQQLAGLIMWVPAGLAYPAAALLIASQWLRRSAA